MTQSEAIEKIISEPKFYIGKLNQSTASNFVASFRKGMAKQSTIDNFLQLFGYVKVKEAEYIYHLDKYEKGVIHNTQHNNEPILQLEGKPSNLKTK